MKNERINGYCDRAMTLCMGLAVFCLPFAKAGVEVFVWVSFFVWMVKRALGYRGNALFGMLPGTGLNRALGVLVAASVLSAVFSVDPGSSWRGFFGKELKFLVLYFMLIETIKSRKRLEGILLAMTASAVLIIADAAMQYFGGRDFIRGLPLWEGGERLTASFSNPNLLAGWLTVMLLLFLGLAASERPRKNILMPLFLVGSAFLSACLLLTYTRGAWLGVAAAFCFAAGTAFRWAGPKARVLILSVVAGLLAVYVILPRPVKAGIETKARIDVALVPLVTEVLDTISHEEKISNSVRINYLKESLMIIRDHPFIGSGLNTYAKVVRRYGVSGGAYAHNSFLQKTAETGFIGLAAFLGVLIVFFKQGFGYLNRHRDPLVLGLVAGILAFLVHGFFDNHLYALQLAVLFWFMLGLTTAAIRLDT